MSDTVPNITQIENWLLWLKKEHSKNNFAVDYVGAFADELIHRIREEPDLYVSPQIIEKSYETDALRIAKNLRKFIIEEVEKFSKYICFQVYEKEIIDLKTNAFEIIKDFARTFTIYTLEQISAITDNYAVEYYLPGNANCFTVHIQYKNTTQRASFDIYLGGYGYVRGCM